MSTADIEAEVTAFFEDYIDTVNESWTSKKALDRRRTMFKDTCRDCLAGYLFAKQAHDQNLTISGDDIELLKVELIDVDGEQISVITTEDSPPGELRDADGVVVQRFDEYLNAQTIYDVRRTDDDWVIVRSEPL